MTQTNNHLVFLDSFFDKLNKKEIPYAVLNKKESLIELMNRRDLDILINNNSRVEILSDLFESIILFQMEIKKIVHKSYSTQIYFYSITEKRIFQIDLITNLIFRFTTIKNVNLIIKNKIKKSNIFFVHQDDLLYYRKVRSLLIKKFNFSNRNKFIKLKKSLEYVLFCIKNFTSFKKIFFLRVKHLFLISNLKNKIFIISILGPDGSGKSTVINEITKSFKLLNINVKDFYVFFGFFPRFKTTKNKVVNTNPHGTIQRSILFQYLKLAFYLTECITFLIYRKFFIYFLNNKDVLLFDRYPYDIYHDPFRYGFSKIPKTLLKFFIDLLTPIPSINIILKCTYEIANKRKQELTEKQFIFISSSYEKAHLIAPLNSYLFDTKILKPEDIKEIIAKVYKLTHYSNS